MATQWNLPAACPLGFSLFFLMVGNNSIMAHCDAVL
jgi:hypothetical protein